MTRVMKLDNYILKIKGNASSGFSRRWLDYSYVVGIRYGC